MSNNTVLMVIETGSDTFLGESTTIIKAHPSDVSKIENMCLKIHGEWPSVWNENINYFKEFLETKLEEEFDIEFPEYVSVKL